MGTHQFYVLVYEMRNEQKNYLRTHSDTSFARMRALEERVDVAIMKHDQLHDLLT